MKINFTGVETSINIPVGIYSVNIYSIKHKQKPGKDPGFEWTFIIQEGSFKGKKVFCTTSMATQALWKFKQMLEDLTGETVSDHFDFEPNKYIGMSCKVSVEANNDPKYNNSVGRIVSSAVSSTAETATNGGAAKSSEGPPKARMF